MQGCTFNHDESRLCCTPLSLNFPCFSLFTIFLPFYLKIIWYTISILQKPLNLEVSLSSLSHHSSSAHSILACIWVFCCLLAGHTHSPRFIYLFYFWVLCYLYLSDTVYLFSFIHNLQTYKGYLALCTLFSLFLSFLSPIKISHQNKKRYSFLSFQCFTFRSPHPHLKVNLLS